MENTSNRTHPVKNYTICSDQDLIALWQRGDDSAFEYLYKKFCIQLLTIAVQKTNNREISEEFVQSTFVTLFKNKNSAHQISSLMAYLYTILKNRILDQHRHDLIHKKYEYYAFTIRENTHENNVDIYIETKELERRLRKEVDKLPTQCGSVFRLRKEQNFSNKEVAAYLNISENTVEQHMRKALRLLRLAFQYSHKTLLILMLSIFSR
jgi:RNA polymerase sigma-70 factor (ECF subfamily)